MNDIAEELARLHTLTGADFSRQVERIALLGEFHPMEGETDIFVTGGEGHADWNNLLNAARKAVEHGYRVFILPNPKGVRTADFIFERRGIYRMYDLKTIQGKASVSNRLRESIGQTNRVLLNMTTDYNAGRLATEIKTYFENSQESIEVLIFKGKRIFSIKRNAAIQKLFIIQFRKMYEK